MLEKLMREIESGGALETGHLAVKLGITPQMLEAMLEHLQRLGIIAAYTSCGDGCSDCGIKEACTPKTTRPRLWQKIR